MTTLIEDDGGRAAAGYKGKEVGDCVTRAVTIATGMPYQDAYDMFAVACSKERYSKRRMARRASLKGVKTAAHGVSKSTYRKLIASLGWTWVPTMAIGSGCKVHLRANELPPGRLIVSVSGHMVAVIDGVVHDTYDSTRGGARCVYGYFFKP
jgi:hypothetical protein